ncbi:MAG TPA: hypothetical protein DCM01_05505 [Dielma fastidiosa]|nr:hypothetical protein [Dielma fastidiosa]
MKIENIKYKKLFVIIGTGGTGSLLARDLPKLLLNTSSKMVIVDGDQVEQKNMKRQAFQPQDIGENKAIALAKKINTFHGELCEAIDKYVTRNELIEFIDQRKEYYPILIGCVDNDATRILLEQTFRHLKNAVYIDSANSEYDGNVYAALNVNQVIYGALRSETYTLEYKDHPTEKSCQELAASNVQYLITNLKMATALLEHCSCIMANELKEGVTVVKQFEEIHF